MKLNLAYLALKALAFGAKAFEKATQNPAEAQETELFEYLNRNKDTEYGRKYGFSNIKSVEEYRKRIPLNSYESLRPYINRMARGEKNILTGDKPVFFSLTSGSTGEPKLLPITEYSRNKKNYVMNLWMYYIIRDHPEASSGKILAIVSPEHDGDTPSGVICGAESGYGYKNIPSAVKNIYAIPYPVFEIPDYDARYYTILRIAMEKDISDIATMTPSTIILLCKRIERVANRVIKDIEKGTLDGSIDVPGDIRSELEKDFKPNPKRAAELIKILNEKKELLPRYFWPNLALIECWKRGTVGLYLEEFPRYFGDVPIRDFGYFSSEARCSVPMTDEGAGGVLAVNANFYEFIPREDIQKDNPKTLLADQLEKGGEYFIILTTAGGLYRYNIDDLIKVDGFFNKTPVIEFVQKGLNVTSVVGEKLYERQVAESLSLAIKKSGLRPHFFAATIEKKDIPRYVFLVEFHDDPAPEKKRDFLRYLEKEIYDICEEYRFNREAQELGFPILKVVKKGEFEKYRIKKVKKGMHDGQFKIPILTGNMEFAGNFNIEEEVCFE